MSEPRYSDSLRLKRNLIVCWFAVAISFGLLGFTEDKMVPILLTGFAALWMADLVITVRKDRGEIEPESEEPTEQ